MVLSSGGPSSIIRIFLILISFLDFLIPHLKYNSPIQYSITILFAEKIDSKKPKALSLIQLGSLINRSEEMKPQKKELDVLKINFRQQKDRELLGEAI